MEIMGHEIEVCAAWIFYKVDDYDYRLKEAKVLRDLYPIFKGYTTAEIQTLMLKKHEEAMVWVMQNFKDTKKHN